MKLIVGLGNPVLRPIRITQGKQAQDKEKYSKTRHNLGFRVVDEFIKKMDGGRWKMGGEDGNWKIDSKFKAEILKQVQDDEQLLFVKPQTFMNNSGMAVKLVADYFKVIPEDIIVIHDDLDLMLGKIKVRMGGAAGGHHGVESIINALGTDQFIRVRLGIGNERSHSGEHKRIAFNAEHFVLEPFMPNEKSKAKHMLKQAVEALEILIDKGLGVAQNQFN